MEMLIISLMFCIIMIYFPFRIVFLELVASIFPSIWLLHYLSIFPTACLQFLFIKSFWIRLWTQELEMFLNSMENKPCCSWDRTGWGSLIDRWLLEPMEMGQAPVWMLGIQSLPSWGSHSSLHTCPPSLWEDIRQCTGSSDVDVFPPQFLLCITYFWIAHIWIGLPWWLRQ